MFCCSSCWNWNGGTLKAEEIPPAPLTMSVEFDSSASFIATGPLKRCQETLKSFNPRCVAHFPDQSVALHDVELQVTHRKLFGQPDLGSASRRRHAADCDDEYACH